MIGTTLAHYRITGELGAGGMGEVWRATDEKLGREVALKVLPEEFASDPNRLDRFEREARAVAALNHPHIVTIFSVEDSDGIRFLTMELVEGRTLDRMIPENGFDAETFFDLATPLAEAISAAHDKSVVHRDLKPSNVMVDGNGRVKVMDFGLAKLQDSGETSDSSELPTEALTGVGMVVGTVPYMSPEQIEGKIVDHRTDVFSLGVLLYEMATGERPFQGESSAGLMSSILRDAPAPVGDRRNDLPNHLGRIISRSLEKDRRDRYQTARDVFNELKALRRESSSILALSRRPVTVPSRQAPRPSSSSSEIMRGDVPWIAVLPFGCPSGEKNVEAFADGLEEDIASGLSRFSYLFVVARKSTGRYRGESIDVRQVGEELGARFVMEGGIRKAGSTIRINVQIVDAETGTHLWTETFDRDLDGTAIFAIQDDITDRVVATVADPYGVVARSMAIPTAAMDPKEMTAYQAVLRYFLFQQRLSQEDHLIAREALERAVEIEPGYADAWSCLTLVVLDEDRHDFNRRPDALDRALSAARRGVESDPASSFAHYALATVYFYRRDLGSFRANAEKAIKLNRRNGNVVAMLGVLYGYSGDWKRGVELTTEAMELNPHHPGWYRFTTFFDHYLKGEYEDALNVAQKINMPGYYAAHMAELLAHTRLGNTAAAENAAREMLHTYPAEDMSGYGRHAEMWFYSQPDLLNAVIGDLRSVGVKVDSPDGAGPTPAPVSSVSKPTASSISAAKEKESVAIAVLPFSDLSPDKDQDYFCEGMAEEIMNALVRIEGIRVASRTSAFRARQEGHGLPEIARLLSVGHVLEGSVRTGGSRLRVTAQLTDVASGYQLWSERFDRALEDVFAVQDEIAAGVVEAVEARLAPGARSIPARPQTGNLEAYRSYLLGQHLRYAKEDHGGAVRAFQEAVRLDPTHAPSWTGLAESLALSAHMSLIPAHEACTDARKALSTAMELQGESADGLHGEAFVAFIERRWDDLEAAVRRAIELQPSHVPSLGLLGMCLSLHQKPDEAEPFFERAREADPLASFPYMLTALGLLTVRRPEEAHSYAEQALTFEKEDASALFCSSLANVALGRFEEGIAAAEHGVAISHRGGDFLGLLGWALASAGREDEARTLLEELRTRPVAAPQIVSEGWLLGAVGETDEAFEVFARAEDQHQLWLYYTGLPGFDPLRTDPRFQALVERLGLPPSPSVQAVSPPVEYVEMADKSIAVLPFVNRSGNPDDEYFSDGLSEELINALSRIHDLRVTARSSAFQFRGQELDVRDVGRKLGVAAVLEGSVRISGNRLRITTELVNCADGYQLWSERFDREMTDIFETQDEIARAIVAKLDVEIGGATEEPLVLVGTENMEAYRLYLKARYLRGKEDHEGARRAFEEAIRLDEAHAPSWTGLAEINALAAHFCLIPSREGCAAARKALATADALQGESADGLHVEGLVAFIERRWAAMENAWRRALELQPTHVLALGGFGLGLCTRQRFDEALPFLERARHADPLASFPYARTAIGFVASGRPEEALRYAEDGLTFEKEDVTAVSASSMAKVALGRFEEGIAEANHAVALSRRGAVFLGILGWALATAGRNGEARAVLEELQARPADSPTVVSEAWLLGALGEIDAAFDVLAQAEEECQAFLNYTGFPAFDPLRSDPRFAALEERFGLPPSPSAAVEISSVETTEIAEKSIAVLPFVNMSADRDDDYFSDGLSEEIINVLTRLPDLRVIARTSAFRFRGEQDLRAVGESLGVRNVLEGSVRRAGERLRITAQLIDVAYDSHIWSERFDREMTDVFEIQDEIAEAIVEKLHVSFGSPEAVKHQTVNVVAYEALLEARYFFLQFTPTAAERARASLERALALEPDYPDALVMRAFYHLMMAYMFADPRDALPNVRASAERALQLDPHHGEAKAVTAVMAAFWDRDWSEGENLFRRALELAPASARVHELYGLCCLLGQGRFDESLAELDRAIELDPLSALYAGNRGRVLTCSRQFIEAEESCRRGLAIDPGQLLAQVELMYALLFQDKFDEAIAVGIRAIETHGPGNAPRQALALSYALAGQRDAAFELVNESAETGGNYRSPLALGLVHAAFNEMDEAFACLEQSFEERDPLLIYLAVHPMYDTLRHDPRFPALVERVGLTPSPSSDASETYAPSIPVGSEIGDKQGSDLAVAPIECDPNDSELCSLASGLTEELTSGFAQFAYLDVLEPEAAAAAGFETSGVFEERSAAGIRYLVAGRLNRVGDSVRLSVRVLDTAVGRRLWSESLDRSLADLNIFEIQDHLADRIVATVADSGGVLVRSIADQLRSKAPERYDPSDWVMRTFAYWNQMREEDHAHLREGLEAAVERDPHHSVIWACLAQVYLDEFRTGFNPREGSLDRALDAALKAVELDPRDSLAQESLADTHFFRRDLTAFRSAADRALAINPRDATTTASMGTWLALSGELQRGFDLTVRAMEINPDHAGWYQIAIFFYHFEAGRFEESLAAAKSMNMPDFFWSHMMTAAAAGKLGLENDSRTALSRLEALCAEPARDVRSEAEKIIVPEDLLAEFLDGLELARLGREATSTVERVSGGKPDAAGIAVLPFADHSAGEDQEWIAHGTHEALLTALQQIGGLRVTSRTSSMLYERTTLALPEIARELGVGWLVEGSVIRVGDGMRITAKLVDGSTDQQIWAGQYETDIRDILAQQTKVAREIAGEVQVVITPEEELRLDRAQPVDPAAYRAYVRGLHHFDRVNPADFNRSIELFEESTSLDPKFAPAHAALAAAYGLGVEFGWISRAEAGPLAEHAIRAVERIDPGSASANRALANVQFHIRRDLQAAEESYRKASELESNAYTLFEFGWLLSQSGRHEEAVQILEEVVAIDPRSPLFRCDLGWWCFGARIYDRAIEEAKFALELDPSFAEAHWLLAISYAELGRFDEALAELERYEVPSGYSVLWYRGYILALAGRRDEALEVLKKLEASGAPGTERAYVLLGLDDRAGVLASLELAESSDIAFQPYLWPRYEIYHDEPRFRALLEKFGLPLPPIGGST